MSLSAVYFLDFQGNLLISHNYRGDINSKVIETFIPLLIEKEDDGCLTPILKNRSCYFIYVKTDHLYVVCTTKKNANATLILVFLHKIINVMTDYLKELTIESIKDNFVIIYELMDEFLDFGYPQITDSKILKEYITQKGYKSENTAVRKVPSAVTNAVSWRSEGITYRKNEVFLDVIESVNLLTKASGHVLKYDINGSMKMKVCLSGMPELKLGLNDKIFFDKAGRSKWNTVELEDVKLHQCVQLSKFANDRVISFIPPDGEFEILTYRLSIRDKKPLIWIDSDIKKYGRSRIEYTITAKSYFKQSSTAKTVKILIPVPKDVDSPQFQIAFGSAIYDPSHNAIQWLIKSFEGGKEYVLKAGFKLPSIENEDLEERLPIQVYFEIPYFTLSGIQIRYLKIIEKSGFQALPWVRYITQNGHYQIRIK